MAKRRANCPLEEENQTAKMSPVSLSSRSQAREAIIQEGPLFDPVNFTSLIQIVNQLDPSSFVKFSRTCKDIHNFCYNVKGIRVPFYCKISTAHREILIEKTDADETLGPYISERELQKLQKMPFTIVVKDVFFFPAVVRVLEEVRQFLRRFTRVVVESVSLCFNADWNDLVQFLQSYNVKHVELIALWRLVIPVDLLPFFLTKLDRFNYEERDADDLILSATAKHLRLPGARISKYTLIDLLQKFANEDIADWEIGREPHVDEDVESDPFIRACTEVMKVVKTEEIDWKTMESSVLYRRPGDPREFFLRQSDGTIGKLKILENRIIFDIGI